MALQVHAVALDMIGALRPLVPRIARHDRSLADQLRRAASSVVLNLAEMERSDAGNARARLCTAAGSLSETRAAGPRGASPPLGATSTKPRLATPTRSRTASQRCSTGSRRRAAELDSGAD